MIIFRADANEHIGIGHVMRCLSIARTAVRIGIDVKFLTADEVSAKVVEKNGFKPHVLKSDWNNYEKDLPEIKEVLKPKKTDWVLVDSYYASQKYLSELKEVTKVAYIDDFMDGVYPCDAIINYAIYADKEFYEKNYPNSIRLIGSKYIPLREEFCGLKPKVINERIKNVLVLSGGSDPYHFQYNLAEKIIKSKAKFEGIDFHFVCGRYNKDYEIITELAQKHPFIRAIRHTDKIEELIMEADIAISAAGSTLYELCACGTPTISYIFADNQKQNAKGFNLKGLIPYAGDVRDNVTIYQCIIDFIRYRVSHAEENVSQSRLMRDIIDGSGAKKICYSLLDNY